MWDKDGQGIYDSSYIGNEADEDTGSGSSCSWDKGIGHYSCEEDGNEAYEIDCKGEGWLQLALADFVGSGEAASFQAKAIGLWEDAH